MIDTIMWRKLIPTGFFTHPAAQTAVVVTLVGCSIGSMILTSDTAQKYVIRRNLLSYKVKSMSEQDKTVGKVVLHFCCFLIIIDVVLRSFL